MLIYLFCIWLALSISVHVSRRLGREIRSRDRLRMIPSWRYFVENSARKEAFVAPDDTETGGSVSKSVAQRYTRRTRDTLWCPERLAAKAMFDTLFMITVGHNEAAKRILLGALNESSDDDQPNEGGLWKLFQKDHLEGTTANLGNLQ